MIKTYGVKDVDCPLQVILSLDDKYSVIIGFDEENLDYYEKLVIKGVGELEERLSIEDAFEKYSNMAEDCLLTMVNDEHDSEHFITNNYFHIYKDEEGLWVSLQTGESQYCKELDEEVFNIELNPLSKDEMKELYAFFAKAKDLNLGRALTRRANEMFKGEK